MDKAVADFQRAITVVPKDVQLYVSLGALYERAGNWEVARDTYQRALTIQLDNPFASNNLAYILLEHGGDVNVALTLAQTARKGLPNLPNSADTLGWAYYKTGAFSAAEPLLEAAVKNAPDDQTYRYHLGRTYIKLLDKPRAKAELEKAISLDPQSPVADLARQAISEISAS